MHHHLQFLKCKIMLLCCGCFDPSRFKLKITLNCFCVFQFRYFHNLKTNSIFDSQNQFNAKKSFEPRAAELKEQSKPLGREFKNIKINFLW